MTVLLALDIGKEFCFRYENNRCVGIREVFPDLASFISVLLKNAYILAGVLLFFLIIFGGFNLIMRAGSGDTKKTAQGQQAFTTAIIGFLLVFASYWIIQIIQIVTGLSILNPKL